jgi:hypothetical protein
MMRRRLMLAVAALALTVAFAAGSAAPADAAVGSHTANDFSSYLPNNPLGGWVDDCYVELGFVVDTVPAPNYRHVGGVRVNCRSYHSVVDATVAMYYWNGSRWVQYGSSTYGVRYSSSGSGSGIGGILRTPRYCVGNLKTTYWMVGATVRTNRTGGTLYTYNHPQRDLSGAGC